MGPCLVVLEPTKEMWPRKRGESEEGAKLEKPGLGAYSAEGLTMMERMKPEKCSWERWTPPKRRYPGVWVGLAKEVWPAERGGSEEGVERREEGLAKEAWSKDRLRIEKGAWSVEREGAWQAGECL